MKETNIKDQSPKPKKSKVWIYLISAVVALAVGALFYWQYAKKPAPKEPELMFPPEYLSDNNDSIKIAADSIREEPEDSKQKTTVRKSGNQRCDIGGNSYSSGDYDDDDDEDDDPEYCDGGKYDPAKYHTDYSADQEDRRRSYIDNDGFDDDDGYDEYRGYEHEYERSSQWDDD